MSEDKITLKCDYCGRKYRVAPEKYKSDRKCPKCGGPLINLATHETQFNLRLEDDKPRVPKALEEGLADKYEVLEMVGRGGMGIVYKARQINLDRVVALKALIGGEGATPQMIDRFVREAQAAGNLRHPNIVQVHDAGEIAGIHYFSMDFIEGISLDKIMDSRSLDTEKSLRLVLRIARALQFAHEHSIIHRDLKPANVIVDFAGEPRIMDFGLAKDLTKHTELSVSGTLIGTPAYMSPEAAKGHIRTLDARSDIYSLGVILYEMLTHSQPFKGDTLYDTITKVINAEPPPPRRFNQSLGPDLDTIVMTAIEKDPDGRYQSMARFADDVEAYLNGEPISARPITPMALAWRKIKKRKVAVLAAFAVLLVVGGLLVLLVTKKSFVDEMDALLKDPSADTRLRAVTLLSTRLTEGKIRSERTRDYFADALLKLAQTDPDARVRLESVKTLRALKVEKAVSALAALAVADADERVQEEAVLAVTELGSADSCGALDQVVRSSAALSVRIRAMRALVALKCPGFVHTLIAIESDLMENKYMRAAAREALEPYSNKGVLSAKYSTGIYAWKPVQNVKNRIVDIYSDHNTMLEDAMRNIDTGPGKQPGTEPAKPTLKLDKLFEQLNSPDAGVRLEAVHALGVLGEPDAVPHIINALEDQDRRVTNAAAGALVKIKAYPSGAQLAQLMDSELPHVRAAAYYLIGEAEYHQLAEQLLARVARESDPDALCVAIPAVAKLKPVEAEFVIRDIMKNSTDPRVKAAADQTLASLRKG